VCPNCSTASRAAARNGSIPEMIELMKTFIEQQLLLEPILESA
jgi:hypothetical protein